MPSADFAAVKSAADTVTIDLSQLTLQGTEKKRRYLAVDTSKKLSEYNAEEQKLLGRVFGAGSDYSVVMEMLRQSRQGIKETKVFVLNPDYVKANASVDPVGRASWLNFFNNNSNFNANDRNINNDNRLRGIARLAETFLLMSLWQSLCSDLNLELAYKNARKHKTLKPYVLEFEENLYEKISLLRTELLLHSYQPKPLETFILRDPKTRKISKSDFRDRVVHHALCNIIGLILGKSFIHDSYANRIGKGALKAIGQFEHFSRKVTKNNTLPAYALKADIRHYFENVDHDILINIIRRKIKDEDIIWLIKKILKNHSQNKGMPLGNLTSQFFANVYLNELDYFVKHQLRVKYYLRYVDDFVIFHNSEEQLAEWKEKIAEFLRDKLMLDLHPEKTRIILSSHGVDFLGLKIFQYHKIMKKRNVRLFRRKLKIICEKFDTGKIIYDEVYDFLEGWIAYVKNADTYNLRQKVLTKFETNFPNEISTKEINRYIKIQKKEDFASCTNTG